MPLFTLVVPTFNVANTLAAALDSVLLQTFADFEVWVIDGASTDDTILLAGQYAQRDTRVRVHSAPDSGVYDAMNKGIGYADGQWLYFLGADDTLYAPTVLETVAAYIASQPAVQVWYGDVLLDGKGRYGGLFTPQKLLTENICHQAIFVARTVFETCGTFDLRFRIFADWAHNLRWMHAPVEHAYMALIVANFSTQGLSGHTFSPKVVREELLLLRSIEQAGYAPSSALKTRYVYLLERWFHLHRWQGSRQFVALLPLVHRSNVGLFVRYALRQIPQYVRYLRARISNLRKEIRSL